MYKLTTERCTFQMLSEDDFEESLLLFTDENVRRHLGGTLWRVEALERLNDWINDDKSLYFSVRLKTTNQLIGIVSISPYYESKDYELSYQFLYEVWGQGYAMEVAKTLLEYCKNELKLKWIVCETQYSNTKSRKLLEKLGYKLEKNIFRFNEKQCVYIYKFDK